MMEKPWHWIDIPPLWLAGFAAMAWAQAQAWPVGPREFWAADLLGGLLVGGGLLLALLAVMEMRRQKTTPIPHQDAQALVVTGIFQRSRNPIYLGDMMILAGLSLFWSAWPSLVLVPALGWVLTDRFIEPEETRLRAKFGRAFEDYSGRVRRWL